MTTRRSWQTDALTLHDLDDLYERIRQLTPNSEVIGTGKSSDTTEVSQKIKNMIMLELKESGSRVRIDDVLMILGALAGFSIQMAIRDHFVRLGKMSLQQAFVVIETKDGGTYFFGDTINEGIVSPHPKQLALWSFVGGAAQHAGAKELPNLEDIFVHVSRSIATPQFGLPRLPPENTPRERPIDLLNKFWNPIRNYMALNVQSAGLWPFILGNSTQLAIIEARDAIDPALAAKIVMEVAIPMSKVDPRLILHAEIGPRKSPEPSPSAAKSPDVTGRAFEEQSAPRRIFGRRQTPL